MYTVIETQTNDQGHTTVVPAVTYNTLNEARAKFHTILAAAAVSSVPRHAAIILDDQCITMARECYEHGDTSSEGSE